MEGDFSWSQLCPPQKEAAGKRKAIILLTQTLILLQHNFYSRTYYAHLQQYICMCDPTIVALHWLTAKKIILIYIVLGLGAAVLTSFHLRLIQLSSDWLTIQTPATARDVHFRWTYKDFPLYTNPKVEEKTTWNRELVF